MVETPKVGGSVRDYTSLAIVVVYWMGPDGEKENSAATERERDRDINGSELRMCCTDWGLGVLSVLESG